LLKFRVSARRSVARVNGNLSRRAADCAPIVYLTGKNLFDLSFRQALHRVGGVYDHGDAVVGHSSRFQVHALGRGGGPSAGLDSRLDIPIWAVPSMIAAIPVVDPSAAMSKV